MSTDKHEAFKEIALLAAEAVKSDDAGELPYYLLGVENYNRLVDLLVGIGALPVGYLEEKRDPTPEPQKKPQSSELSRPATHGDYTIRYQYEA